MKKEIITLIIGILIGAIVTTAVFLIIKANTKPSFPDFDKSNFTMKKRDKDEEIEFDGKKFDKKEFNKDSEENNKEESN